MHPDALARLKMLREATPDEKEPDGLEHTADVEPAPPVEPLPVRSEPDAADDSDPPQTGDVKESNQVKGDGIRQTGVE